MVAVAIGVGVAGVIGGAGNLIGGEEAASGEKQAAATEAQAQTQAVQAQTAAQQQALGIEQPFIAYGTTAGNELSAETQPGGALAQQPSLTGADITQMPGYEFSLQQGLLATQNAAAAQGLGVSGTALGAASQYATGLAATNYQNYFNDFWANQNNRYNMLYNLTTLGANTATQAGTQLNTSAANIGNTLTTSAANIGQAQAAAGADVGTGISSAASSAGTGLENALLANALVGQQGGSTINNLMTGAPQTTAGTSAMYGIPMEQISTG